MPTCKHKFVHRNNDSFRQSTSRYCQMFTSIDYYFCEKCLEEKEIKKEISIMDHELPSKLPDWAKVITKKIPDAY